VAPAPSRVRGRGFRRSFRRGFRGGARLLGARPARSAAAVKERGGLRAQARAPPDRRGGRVHARGMRVLQIVLARAAPAAAPVRRGRRGVRMRPEGAAGPDACAQSPPRRWSWSAASPGRDTGGQAGGGDGRRSRPLGNERALRGGRGARAVAHRTCPSLSQGAPRTTACSAAVWGLAPALRAGSQRMHRTSVGGTASARRGWRGP